LDYLFVLIVYWRHVTWKEWEDNPVPTWM
jgi:hypothetical protein